MNKRSFYGLLVLFIISIGLFIMDIIAGSVYIPVGSIVDVFLTPDDVKESWRIIVLDSRLPKAITAITCGMALSVSGLQMQTLFRNPLAGPYILGISSGAGFGVALVTIGVQLLHWQIPIALNNYVVVIASVIGASMVMVLIFIASIKLKDIMTVLILGVMLAAIINAIIGIMQYFSSAADLKTFIVWTFGSLDAVSMPQATIIFVITSIVLFLVFNWSKELNLLLLGDNYARSMGVKIIPIRLLIVLSTSVLAGGVTAFCGPIGFIGIVVPHLCRILFKTSDHRLLIPSSALMGTIFMLISDIISHLPGQDGILPLNSVTAILGIPVILWILLNRSSISSSF